MGQMLVKAFEQPPEGLRAYKTTAQVAVQLFSGPRTWSQYYQCLQKPYVRGWVWSWKHGWTWSWKWPNVPKSANLETDCGIKWITPMSADHGHFATNMKNTASLIEAENWPATSTFTSLALAQAQQELIYAREGATRVTVVVTDGIPINPGATDTASGNLKKNSRVIWVPVTANAPKEQLESWASHPKEQNVVMVGDFSTLETPDVVTQIIASACPDAM
jgi:hypothetical protein